LFGENFNNNHFKAWILTRKSTNKATDKATKEPSKEVKVESSGVSKKKQKTNNRNFVVTTPANRITQVAPTTQPNKKPYNGDFLKCKIYKYHHPTTISCRQCLNGGRFDHLFNACHEPVRVQAQQPNVPAITQPNDSFVPNGCAFYQCGDPTHFHNTCP
jgi:hypothetical protein